ncbi:MAG: Gfo/Idh/MocA family protein [Terrimicrobiaceae bacterium]
MKNITIVGCGFMGAMHAQAYAQIRGAKICALVDNKPAAAAKSMRALGIVVPIFKDLETALDKVETDAVDICLPTPLHESAALTAFGRKKAVFIEKPIALDLAAAKRIVAAAKKCGVAVQVGHCIRFWPEYQALVELFRSGRLGSLLSLSLQRRSPLPAHSIGGWLLDEDQSGGAALDLHIHDTDFVLHLLGHPDAVTSSATEDRNGISHIFTSYDFVDKAVVAEGGWNYPAKWGFQMAYQAVFEKGTVEYDSAQGTFITQGSSGKKPLPVRQPGIGTSQAKTGNISSLGGYYNELASFVSCLESGKMPVQATPQQATDSLRVTLAEIESARKGRRVALNNT